MIQGAPSCVSRARARKEVLRNLISAPFMAWETAARSVASPWTTWTLGLVMVSFSGDRASAGTRTALTRLLVASDCCCCGYCCCVPHNNNA